ncbi:flagellar export protein FliJ [Miltoncostaea marina]|uniref:flagellar export protein FliJ n=1 Tax=Miltoncostaea marina TaxID=2843215 RepID=UPI001C3E3506|nr:flagellar FliJ family protein [Miltoncostaea marina]
MSDRFRFRLEQVLDHRVRREDLVRQELAQAMAAVAAQQERAVAAEDAVRRGLDGLRRMMGEPIGLDRLRAAHEDLAILRARAAHERSGVARLEAVADDRRADMVRASQDREALVQLRRRAEQRHGAELARRDAVLMDELAARRARVHGGAAA